ncbi:MAG: hypothetical protein JSS43_14665, partial [Proteobacteria bacterium]|nr:hypothetical protein [Pseudomonadota bacterium]
MVTLYLLGWTSAYHYILTGWGVPAWPFPFLDTRAVLSAVQCQSAGVDVYVTNPCDPLGRPFNYSPLWLILLPSATGSWLQPIGLAFSALFLSSLSLLPAGRTWRDVGLITSGVLATPVVFALERGNIDVVIFVLAAVAATLMERSLPLRLVGYGSALLAGLLKYYPVALMGLAIRESPRVFFSLTAVSVFILVAFIGLTAGDLFRALALIPTGPYISRMIGSVSVPGAVAEFYDAAPWMRSMLHLTLIAVAATLGVRWALTSGVREHVERLTCSERTFLLAGTLITLSFYFTAQNIGYRLIHLVLTLPALTALRRVAPASRACSALVWLALAMLWSQAWWEAAKVLVTSGADPVVWALTLGPAWLLGEAVGWCLATLFIGLLAALCLRSTMA